MIHKNLQSIIQTLIFFNNAEYIYIYDNFIFIISKHIRVLIILVYFSEKRHKKRNIFYKYTFINIVKYRKKTCRCDDKFR